MSDTLQRGAERLAKITGFAVRGRRVLEGGKLPDEHVADAIAADPGIRALVEFCKIVARNSDEQGIGRVARNALNKWEHGDV